MDRTQASTVLQQTGNLLAQTAHNDSLTVIHGGAVAAVAADLPATRVTHDCDVLVSKPEAGWEAVREAARQVAGNVVCPLTGSTATTGRTPIFCRSVGGNVARWLADSDR